MWRDREWRTGEGREVSKAELDCEGMRQGCEQPTVVLPWGVGGDVNVEGWENERNSSTYH